MATTTCGWCGRDVHMTQLAKHPSGRRTDWGDNYVSDAAYKCDNCGRYSVVSWYSTYDPTESYRSGEPEDYDRSVVWSPPHVTRPEYADVPEHIANASREAWLCYAHGATVAACAVARSVIEAAAKAHDVTVRGIEPKIDALKEQGLIWGDLIRLGSLGKAVRQRRRPRRHSRTGDTAGDPRRAGHRGRTAAPTVHIARPLEASHRVKKGKARPRFDGLVEAVEPRGVHARHGARSESLLLHQF